MNAICPGYINTEMVQAVPKDVLEKSILPLIPIGRLGEPEEIARCVVFLAVDDAGLITGATLYGQWRAVFRLIDPSSPGNRVRPSAGPGVNLSGDPA